MDIDQNSFEENKFEGYNGVKLHFMENVSVDNSLVPVLIVPALPESAIDYKDVIYLLKNRTIAFTHRGRELSDAPETGYSLEDHAQDIVCAIAHFKLEECILIAYSRGVAYLLQALPHIVHKIKGIIIIDYPASYEEFSLTWPAQFLNQSWRAMPNKERFPNPWVLTKIQQESKQSDFWDKLSLIKDIPVLLMIGGRSYLDPFLIRSKVSDDDLNKYKSCLPKINIIEFENSGHDLRLWEYDKFINTIKEFLSKFNQIDKNFHDLDEDKSNNIIKRNLHKFFNKSPGIDKNKVIKLQ